MAVTDSHVESSFLRYPLLISQHGVRVFTPNGRKVADVASVKQARLLIRFCRKEERGR